jgi:hypothetical protein
MDLDAKYWCTIKKDGQKIFDRFEHQGHVALDRGLICHQLERKDNVDISLFLPIPLPRHPNYEQLHHFKIAAQVLKIL